MNEGMIMPELKTPLEALALARENVILIDIREPEEFMRDRIEGAKNIPLSTLEDPPRFDGDILVMCQSGKRTGEHNYPLFQRMSLGKISILEGGLNAWNVQKLPKTWGKV